MDFLILGGLIAALTTAWSYVKTIWFAISSILVTQIEIQGDAVVPVIYFLNNKFRKIDLSPKTFDGWSLSVLSLSRVMMVPFEILSKSGSGITLYKSDRRFIWVSDVKKGRDQINASFILPQGFTISFIRSTFNTDQLIIDAFSEWNKERAINNRSNRFRVRRIYGVMKYRQGNVGGDGNSSPTPTKSDYDRGWTAHRVLGYSKDDLGKYATSLRVEHLALSNDVEDAISFARRWLKNEQWFKDRHVPWKLGWMLYGEPGNGKTALVRAVAEEFDFPVYAYDLASLTNEELQREWHGMLSETPCIALIEDIDSVFEGRESKVNENLTFDCLLNCIDGIEQSSGVFFIVTTNNIDKVDKALGVPDNGSKSSRPGRVDVVLPMDRPNEKGRQKIAQRILRDWPELVDGTVVEGHKDTGAQFQDRCVRLALSKYRSEWHGSN